MLLFNKKHQEQITLGESRNALVRLILVQLVVFILLIFLRTYFYFLYRNQGDAVVQFNERILHWFALSGDLSSLAAKPWTIITNFFSHTSVWSIVANTLWLGLFGYIFQELTGNRKIVPVFLYGGLVGSIAFLVASNLLGYTATNFYGASTAIMAVAVATTATCPGYKIFPAFNGGIPLWSLTLFYVLISFGTLPAYQLVYYIPLLAGMTIGWLFIFFIKKGYDWGEWMNNFYDWGNNLFNPDKPQNNFKIKEHLFYKCTGKPFSKTTHVTQNRVDEILDKISQQGYDKLSDAEKELLARTKDEDI